MSSAAASDGPQPFAMGLLFVTVFLDLVGFGIVLPLLPYFATDLGASALVVGAIVASYSLMQFLFSPLWGSLSDRLGRRPLLIVGLLGSSVSYVVFGLAESVLVLLASRIVAGVMGATVPVAQAMVADATSPERRARGMGMIGAAFGLGFIFGPVTGGVLSRYGYAVPGFVAAALAALATLAAVFLLPETLPPENRSRTPIGWSALGDRLRSARLVIVRPELVRPIGVFFLMTLGFAGFMTAFPLFLDRPLGFTAREAGWLFAYVGLISAVIQGRLIGPVVERYGERRVAGWGAITLASGMTLIAAVPSFPPLMAALALIGIGWGFVVPSLHSLISRRALAREQGEVLGVNQSVSSAARVAGPLAAGWGFDALGPELAFAAGAGLLLVGAALAVSIRDGRAAYFG